MSENDDVDCVIKLDEDNNKGKLKKIKYATLTKRHNRRRLGEKL